MKQTRAPGHWPGALFVGAGRSPSKAVSDPLRSIVEPRPADLPAILDRLEHDLDSLPKQLHQLEEGHDLSRTEYMSGTPLPTITE